MDGRRRPADRRADAEAAGRVGCAAGAGGTPTPRRNRTAGNGAARTQPAAGGQYTVAEGDTLWSIAQQLGTTTDALVEANHLEDADLLVSGRTLVVPGRGSSSGGATSGRARGSARRVRRLRRLAGFRRGGRDFGGAGGAAGASAAAPARGRRRASASGAVHRPAGRDAGRDRAAIRREAGRDRPGLGHRRSEPDRGWRGGQGAAAGLRARVVEGETLRDIAAREKVDLGSLVDFNEIEDPELIRVGQVVCGPGAGAEPAGRGIGRTRGSSPRLLARLSAPCGSGGSRHRDPAAGSPAPAAPAAAAPAAPAAPGAAAPARRGGAGRRLRNQAPAAAANAAAPKPAPAAPAPPLRQSSPHGWRWRRRCAERRAGGRGAQTARGALRLGRLGAERLRLFGPVWYAVRQSGKAISRGMLGEYNSGSHPAATTSSPATWSSSRTRTTPGLSHNGIYVGNGQFVHAADEQSA